MHYTLGLTQINSIEGVLQKDIMGLGATCVVLIDTSGNIIAHLGTGRMQYAVYSLAALAAGNYSAVTAMAEIIGEHGFSLLYHKGKKESMHFGKIMDDFLLVTVFGKEVSLGSLRLKTAEAIKKIEDILKDRTIDQAQIDSAKEALQFWTLKERTAAQAKLNGAEDALQFWALKERTDWRLEPGNVEDALSFWAEGTTGSD